MASGEARHRTGSDCIDLLVADIKVEQSYCSDLVVANSKFAHCFLLIVLIETLP